MTRRTSAEVQADQDAAKWRALCAFLTNNGVDPEKITPDAIADAAIFVFGRFEVASADVDADIIYFTSGDAGESYTSNLPY